MTEVCKINELEPSSHEKLMLFEEKVTLKLKENVEVTYESSAWYIDIGASNHVGL